MDLLRRNRFVSGHHLLLPFVMNHNRPRVVLRIPILIYNLFRAVFLQFGDPLLYINTLRVELLRLKRRIHYTKPVERAWAHPSHDLPTAIVLRWVIIVEMVRKKALPYPPIVEQILREKTGDQHPHAVVHEARRRHLANPRVDDWVTGPPLIKCVQKLRVRLVPFDFVPFLLESPSDDVWVKIDDIIVEITKI